MCHSVEGVPASVWNLKSWEWVVSCRACRVSIGPYQRGYSLAWLIGTVPRPLLRIQWVHSPTERLFLVVWGAGFVS